jgi:hypothetical protein
MTFSEKELDDWKQFVRKMEREFGEHTHTGTDNATILVNYSPELRVMLRPSPPSKHYEFDLKLLSCKGCKKKALWLCLPAQLDYQCDDCQRKEKKSGCTT